MSKKAYFFSLLSGILLFLSFPKYGNPIVAWMALVPLFILLKSANAGEAFRAGLTTGLVYNIGILYWISYVIAVYGNIPAYAGIMVMLLLAGFLAFFVAFFARLVVYFRDKGINPLFSAPLLWIGLEYCKSHILTGFPWENLAYSQYSLLPVVQISDITGFYGVSFLIVFINVIVSDLLVRTGTKQAVAEVTAGLMLLALTCGYGFYRIQAIDMVVEKAVPERVSVIQGNIDQAVKWDPVFQDETIKIFKEMTLTSAANNNKPGLIIWPETATPFYFQATDPRYPEILKLAQMSRTYLLFGCPFYNPEKGPEESYNSAFLISPDGRLSGQYNKMHLVPFGEYVPLRKMLPFMTNLVPGIGDFSVGKEATPLSINNRKIGVLICYEAIFPEITRSFIKAGADLLVNITNDAWFGNTSAPYQHLSMTAFRAIESRRYVVRSANTGISAVIGPTGKIEATTELFKRTILDGQIRYMTVNTFYSRMGDIFAYGCLALLGFLFILAIRRRDHVGRIKAKNCGIGKQSRKASELSLKSPARKRG